MTPNNDTCRPYPEVKEIEKHRMLESVKVFWDARKINKFRRPTRRKTENSKAIWEKLLFRTFEDGKENELFYSKKSNYEELLSLNVCNWIKDCACGKHIGAHKKRVGDDWLSWLW